MLVYCSIFFCAVRRRAGLSTVELPNKPDIEIKEKAGSATLVENVTEIVFNRHGNGVDCTMVPNVNDGQFTVNG